MQNLKLSSSGAELLTFCENAILQHLCANFKLSPFDIRATR